MNHYYTHFDALWNELTKGFELTPYSEVGTHAVQAPKECVSLPKYPVSNCWITNDMNTLNFEFAVAGYKEDTVKVLGGKHSFTVKAEPEEGFMDNEVVLHKGISRRPIEFSINVDEQYDVKKTKVSCANGMLRVSVPKAKDSETVLLFG